MKYVMLIYVPEDDMTREHPGEMDGHLAVGAEAMARGKYVTCEALQPAPVATTIRVRDGETLISDGPFAETKEVLGGFYLLECDDLDEAISYARRIPPAAWGSIEIRPVNEMPEWEAAVRAEAGKLRAAMR
jgi:hypothetical protein